MRKSELLFLLVFTIGRSAFSTSQRLRNLADGRKFAGQQPAAALIFAVVPYISHWISVIFKDWHINDSKDTDRFIVLPRM